MWFPGADSTPISFTPSQKYKPGTSCAKNAKSSAPVEADIFDENNPSDASIKDLE